MNRLLNILLVCLLQVSWAVASTYNLKVEVTPNGAGSLNTGGGNYEEGSSISLRTYNYTGFVFQGWYDGETLLSSSQSFYYTMPAKDVTVHAKYEYDPSVPANPEPMPIRYTLNIQCKPAGSGSFNTNNTIVREGENTRLYAYTNTGFKFLRWEDNDGNTLSSEQNFYYVMPHGNQTIYGIFEYDPEPPSNPLKNYWNSETREVIVDDFKQNSLSSAISDAIGNSSRNDVSMITVAGKMGNNDFGIVNNFSNCMLLDLSRTTGVTHIPSYAFDYTNLESVYLPTTVEKIGYRAFADCSQLLSLTVYAMTPPVLDSYVFDGVQEGLVVYVPAGAIPQYQEAEGWKNFTLLPIQEDIRNLTVNLPAGTNVADYAQMWLELTNTKNGQRIHYVMTDKTAYTFMNIIRNTSWNITLCNQSGDVFGKIDNVEVKDEDVTVTFASLTQPKSVNLSVKTPDGQDVTQQTQITWTNAEGKYLSQGCSLTGLPVGYQTKYKVILSEQLAMLYNVPTEAEYTLTATDNNPVCQLTAIGQVKVSGKVVDKKTNQPVSGAVISASQTFGGKYSKTFSCKTDNKGEYSIDLYKVPSSIAFSAADYVSQTLGCDSIVDASGALAMQDVALKEIAGAVISLSLTYTPCAEDGETAEVQNWFNDYNNVGYTLYNKTKNRTISQFNVQYPQIVLLEEVADGDELLLTATSKTGAFMPVQENVVIAEQAAEATVNIIELGKIDAAFSKNINSSVKGILYDGNGKLVKSYDYAQASLSIGNLTDGSYTLVSMGDSKLFSSIYDLSQFSQAGLTEGTDYVKNTVAVQSGKISKISIEEIPTFNESKLYYTGENTSFTVNKSSIVAGNYLTLSGRIDFKPAYVSSVSNIQMMVDLPENCSFVENSVMVGNNTSSYTLNGTRLTIPVARLNDRIRFCVIPTLGGEYAPSAFAQFDMNGETITQPIGSATCQIKNLDFIVPTTINSEKFQANGMAPGGSQIEIYEDGIVIGITKTLANGTWTAECTIPETYNLTSHTVYAIITTKEGLKIKSESVAVELDRNNSVPKTVLMTFYNGWLHKNVDVTFNFTNMTIDNPGYMFYTKTKLSFVADFTDNNPEHMTDVTLWTLSSNNTETAITMSYDIVNDKWIGSHDFDYYTAPVNLTLEYTYAGQKFFDRKQLSDFNKNRESILIDNLAERADFIAAYDADVPEDEVSKRLDELFSQEEPDEDEIRRLLDMSAESETTTDTTLSDDEFDAICKQADDSWTEWETNVSPSIRELVLTDYFADPKYDLLSDYEITSELEDGIKTVSKKKLTSVNYEELEANGYSAITLDDGSAIYVLYNDNLMEIIDCAQLVKYSIIVEQSASPTMMARANVPLTPGSYLHYANTAKNAIQTIYYLPTTDKRRWLVEVAQKIKEATEGISKFYESFMNDFNKNIQTAYSRLTVLCDKEIEDQEAMAEAAKELIKEYTDKIEKNKEQREVLKKNRDVVKNSTTISEDQKQRLINEYDEKIQKLTDENKHLNGKRAGTNAKLNKANSRIASIKDKSTRFRKVHTKIREAIDKFPKRLAKGVRIPKYLRVCGKVAGELGVPLQCWSLFMDMVDMADDISDWIPLMDKIDVHHCYKKGDSNAVNLHESIYDRANKHALQNVGILSTELGSICFSIAGGVPGSPTWWAEIGFSTVAELWKHFNDKASLNERTDFRKQVNSLKCDDKDDDKDNKHHPKDKKHNYPFNPATPIHDPSGYVYEAVATNRLEGVTATCFYKETVEDMYGDLHENIVKWDAAEYAQENPLFTDENGMYRWDVPQGLWQVKFEKEGYETTYSEWLPVPPPQLDVNIAMKQNVQPVVKNARAFENAVEVEFDKYMIPELLNTDNILVMADGKALEGKVELLNEEVSYEGNTDTYASKIRFNAVNPFPAKDVTLLVKNQVKSYAGIRMQEDYQQDFTVEQEIKQIVCDSLAIIDYGKSSTLTVEVLPASASKGKALTIKTSSPMILGVETAQVTVGDDGKAEITVSGELPGTAALTFTVEGTDRIAQTIVSVEQKAMKIVALPKASIASGTVVEKGMAVTLSCETKGATIYYTLDGSCPCDATDARKVYDGTPITINESVTIKAMAVAPDMYESDVAEFVYLVEPTGVDEVTMDALVEIFPLPVHGILNVTAGGKTVKGVSVYSAAGNLVAASRNATTKVTLDVSNLPAGNYIVSVSTEEGVVSRKIQKVL